MIDVFLFSLAGKKTNHLIDDLLLSLIESKYIPDKDKKILNHTIEVSKNGNYPTKEYYLTFYSEPEFTYKSLAEIATHVDKCKDFYKRQFLQRKIISSLNDAETSDQLISRVEDLLVSEATVDTSNIDGFTPNLYSDELKIDSGEGCISGISEIDELVSSLLPGTITALCAFTGHGKSTTTISMIFKNIMQGKKCCLMSIEVPPKFVWLQFQARYLYEVKGMTISYTDLQHKKLTKEMAEQVNSYDEDFKNDIVSNLMILDESVLNKDIVTSYRHMSKLFREVERRLGGLDLVAWDHIGQLELLFPTMGNQIIKQIQSFTKTYKTDNGNLVTTLFAVQTNREGERRAARRDGEYDIQAISDLNEIERSSSYIIFQYTSSDMIVVQETKVQLKKQRQGAVMPEPIVTTFNPSCCMVGSTINKVSLNDEDFADLGDMSFDDDF